MNEVECPEPRARPVVIGVCPFCAGQGTRPTETFERDGATTECERCGGTGDLDETRLRAAYDLGREDALAHVRELLAELRTMVGLTYEAVERETPPISYEGLRARIGG